MPVPKILFATDFSNYANHAFHVAVRMAKNHKAPLLIVHVFESPTAWEFPQTADPTHMAQLAAEASNEQLRKQYGSQVEDIPTLYISVEQIDAAQGLLSVIEEQSPDLVVVGTKGQRNADEIRIGSTARTLTLHSPVPVLAVPQKAFIKEIEKVVFATDFLEEDLQAIDQLAEWMRFFHPELFVVHISPDRNDHATANMQRMKNNLPVYPQFSAVSWELLVDNQVNNRLQEFIRRHEIDLLVMVEKELHGLFRRWFHADHVQTMEQDATVPILTFSAACLHPEGDVAAHS